MTPIAQVVLFPIIIGIQFMGLTGFSLSLQGFVNDFFSMTLGCI